MEHELLYFNFGGRAAGPRLALFNALGKDGWKDTRFESFPQFHEEKAKHAEGTEPRMITNVMGYVPQLTVTDTATGKKTVFTQGASMARYAAKLNPGGQKYKNLYPLEDALAALVVDEVMQLGDELMTKTPHDKDPEVKKTKREEYAEIGKGMLWKGMNLMETRVEGPFVLGAELSLGDMAITAITDMIMGGDFDHVPATYVAENFPKLEAHSKAVKEHGLMKEYLENYKC